MKYSTSNWPHRWFGFWADFDKVNKLPHSRDFKDREWAPRKLKEILNYLTSAPVAIASTAERSPCGFCGKGYFDPGCFRSDGLWLWPDSLAHEVTEHQIRLPDAFLAHMEEAGFTPPDTLDSNQIDNLPWPKL